MARWKKPFKLLAKGITRPLRWLRVRTKRRLGWLDKPRITTNRALVAGRLFFIEGMVLEDSGLAKPREADSRWKNLKAMLKRYWSDPLPGISVEIIAHGMRHEAITDESGIFRACLRMDGKTGCNSNWLDYSISLRGEWIENQSKVQTHGKALCINGQAATDFGIITDIDDTVLVSHATQFVKKLRLLFFKNALTRIPFAGVQEFYTALHQGPGGRSFNPVFYVSNSEWNLYDLLQDFFKQHKLPLGPFFLRERVENPLNVLGKRRSGRRHKMESMRFLLNVYPELDFILIGDSGQNDPVVYEKIAREYPGRIKTIYIRNINSRKTKFSARAARRLKEEYGLDMVLVKKTGQAMDHAFANAYLAAR